MILNKLKIYQIDLTHILEYLDNVGVFAIEPKVISDIIYDVIITSYHHDTSTFTEQVMESFRTSGVLNEDFINNDDVTQQVWSTVHRILYDLFAAKGDNNIIHTVNRNIITVEIRGKSDG